MLIQRTALLMSVSYCDVILSLSDNLRRLTIDLCHVEIRDVV